MKKKLINLNWLENVENIFLFFHSNQRLQKSYIKSNLDATSKTKWTNKSNYYQL